MALTITDPNAILTKVEGLATVIQKVIHKYVATCVHAQEFEASGNTIEEAENNLRSIILKEKENA